MSTFKHLVIISASVAAVTLGGGSFAGTGSGDCNSSSNTSCRNALLNEIQKKCGAGTTEYKSLVKAGKKAGVFYWDKQAVHIEVKQGKDAQAKYLIGKYCKG